MKDILNRVFAFFKSINQKYKDLYNTKLKLILQFFPSNFYLLLLFICLLVVVTPKIINNKICVYSTEHDLNKPKELVKETVHQEIYTKNVSNIDDLGIKFSTYMRVNHSKYIVTFNEDDKKIYEEEIDASKLVDNEYRIFDLDLKIKKGSKYSFDVKPVNVKKGNGVTIATNKDGDYTYRLYGKSKFYNESIILSIVFIMLFMFINYLINNGKIKSEEKYYKIMTIYFVLVVFIFPPLFAPDSLYHFDRAYNVSQNNVIKFITSTRFYRHNEPENLYCIDYGDQGEYLFEVESKEKIQECFNKQKVVKSKKYYDIQNKVGFIFSSIGIKVARLFTDSPMIFFYVGRIFNLLASFLIILYALKIAPKHKKILLSLVLIPVFIQQMCSYSYDSTLNSLCVLVIAYLIKFFNEKEKIRIKDLIIYTLSLAIILQIKVPYVLVGLPIIFVDKEKFGNKKINKILYLFVFAIFIGIAYLIPKIGNDLSMIDTSGSGERGMSLKSLFNIKYTLRLIYSTVKFNTKFYLETFIGGLAWLNKTYITKVLIYSYFIFMLLVVLSEKQSVKIKKIIKIFMILINVALIGGIFLAMYLAWTTPDSKVIEGVQGRYLFAPILGLLLCLIPKNNKINISDETFYSFFNISCVIYLITILYLFY